MARPKINGIALLTIIGVVGAVSLCIGYVAGKAEGEAFGRHHGYFEGQLELIDLLRSELEYTVNSRSKYESQDHLLSTKDISMYAVEINGTRTIAIWED